MMTTRLVEVSSIAAGEFAENELRKQFTPSERWAIRETIQRKPNGDQRRSPDRETVAKASELAGFSSRQTAERVGTVVTRGIPELVAAMDSEELSIDAAALIAKEPPDRQKQLLRLPQEKRAGRVKTSATARPARTG